MAATAWKSRRPAQYLWRRVLALKSEQRRARAPGSPPTDRRATPLPTVDDRLLFASVPVPLLVLDPEFRIVAVNDAYLRVTMTKEEEILGRDLFAIFPDNPVAPDARGLSNLRASLSRVLQNKAAETMAVQKYDLRRRAEEGGGFEERYWSLSNTPVCRGDGEIAYLIHRVEEISEVVHLQQKRREAEKLGAELEEDAVLKEAERYARAQEIERLASFPLLNPNPLLELDGNGRMTFCNPAAQQLLDQSGGDNGINPLIPPDLPVILQRLQEKKAGQFIREVEINSRFFEEVIYLTAPFQSIRIYTMEITSRKKAEERREELLMQLDAVLDNINEGVVISSLAGRVLTMNKEALALHQYQSIEEIRRPISEYQQTFELSSLSGEPVPFELWPLLRAIRGERFADCEVRVRRKDTGKSWIASYSGAPVRGKSGETILSVITVRDISAQKAAEEEIRSLNLSLAARAAELEDANRELETFNYTAAHDLRQPLNAISSYCQVINELCGDRLDAKCKEYLRETYGGTLRMNMLIEALLNFSRLAYAELIRARVDLASIAREVAGELTRTDDVRRVEIRIDDKIMTDGDANLLRVVLANLLGNAWKYTAMREAAVIEFAATAIDGQPVFYVRDNGPGFAAADADKLFAPFLRLPGAEKCRGFGIGLATVERIIRRHGGRIWAEGEPGKGATFYFTLE